MECKRGRLEGGVVFFQKILLVASLLSLTFAVVGVEDHTPLGVFSAAWKWGDGAARETQ